MVTPLLGTTAFHFLWLLVLALLKHLQLFQHKLFMQTHTKLDQETVLFCMVSGFFILHFCGGVLGVFFWKGCLFVWGLVVFLFLCLFIFISFVWWFFGRDGGGFFWFWGYFPFACFSFPVQLRFGKREIGQLMQGQYFTAS